MITKNGYKLKNETQTIDKIVIDMYGLDKYKNIRKYDHEGEPLQDRMQNIEENISVEEIQQMKADINTKVDAPFVENKFNALQYQIDIMDYVETIVQNSTTKDLTIIYKNGNHSLIEIGTGIVSGEYDETNKTIILNMEDGTKVIIPVSDLVSGLASQDYVNSQFILKENVSNKIINWDVPTNNQYPSAKLVNDTIQLVRQETINITDELKTSKANKDEVVKINDIAQVYGGKNLARLDLRGKEYLGGGNYLLREHNGITYKLNVYSGILTLNGTSIAFSDLDEQDIFESQNDLIISYLYIGGTINKNFSINTRGTVFTSWITGLGQENKSSYWSTTRQKISGFYVGIGAGTVIDNLQFKIQLEKGSTATPYTLPMYVTPELLDTKANDNEVVKTTGAQLNIKGAKSFESFGILNTKKFNFVSEDFNLTAAIGLVNNRFHITDGVKTGEIATVDQLNGQTEWELLYTTTNANGNNSTTINRSNFVEFLVTCSESQSNVMPANPNIETNAVCGYTFPYGNTSSTPVIAYTASFFPSLDPDEANELIIETFNRGAVRVYGKRKV